MRLCYPLLPGPVPASARLGGKATNLWHVGNVPGVRIPASTAIDARALEMFVDGHFTTRAWSALVRDYRAGQRAPLFAELAHAPLPDGLLDSLPSAPLLMVRSSGVAEDGARTSLAGHFESMACTPDPASLAFAVKACWLVGLRLHLDLLAPHAPPRQALRSLALVVQEVIPAVRSGVYFSQSPIQPGRSLVVANWGTCHSVVEGTSATDSYVLRRGQLDSQQLRYKFDMTVIDDGVVNPRPGQRVQTSCGPTSIHGPHGRHVYVARVPAPRDGQAVLQPSHLKDIVGTAARIRRSLGYALDMEWSYRSDDLVVLQARPITTRPPRRAVPSDAVYAVASQGVARGRVRLVSSPRDSIESGDIIAVAATDPDYMPILYRAGGILSEEGSPLSHTAIVARELKIPCLLGVPRGAVSEGDIVTVDGNRGRIGQSVSVSPKASPRSSNVLDVTHLRRGLGPVTLAWSALMAGFLAERHWSPPTPEALASYRLELQNRYGLSRLDVAHDVHGD